MIIVNIIAGLILFFSFVGGFMQGAVKSFFAILALIIAIPVTGRFYHYLANVLSFLPGEDWENLLGFFVVMGIAIIILHFVFYFPRKLTEQAWNQGFLFRLVGGVLNLLNSAIGLVVFALVIAAFPVWGWLADAMSGSAVVTWLVSHLGFVQNMLPEVMRNTNWTTV